MIRNITFLFLKIILINFQNTIKIIQSHLYLQNQNLPKKTSNYSKSNENHQIIKKKKKIKIKIKLKKHQIIQNQTKKYIYIKMKKKIELRKH